MSPNERTCSRIRRFEEARLVRSHGGRVALMYTNARFKIGITPVRTTAEPARDRAVVALDAGRLTRGGAEVRC